MHPDELGARPDEPERPIEVVVGHGLGRVADDDRGRPGTRRVRLLVAQQPLPVELGQRVRRGDDEQRRTRIGAGRVGGAGRQRDYDPVGRDRGAEPARPSGQVGG